MHRATRTKGFSAYVTFFLIGIFFSHGVSAFGGEIPPAPKMPAHWRVISDYQVPSEKAKAMSIKLGAILSSVRNTVYDVNGKRVQLNVISTPDNENAKKLMTKLKSMKSEDGLLRKGLIVYEFVGQNDVLPLVKEGRNHLASM